jgi:thiol-disulfide isomerase/thioredoxin
MVAGAVATTMVMVFLAGWKVASQERPPVAAIGGAASSSGATAVPATAFRPGVTVLAPAQRQAAPEVRGTTLDGSPLALSSLRGHVVVLNVWASWCEPCRTESPALVAVAGSLAGTGTQFVGLDEKDTAAAALDFLQSVHSTYPHLVDDGALLARLGRWLPQAVPGTLVLDPQGRVAARVIGPVSEGDLRTVLAALAGHS